MPRKSSRTTTPNLDKVTLLGYTINDIMAMQQGSYETLQAIKEYIDKNTVTQNELDLFKEMLKVAQPYLGDIVFELGLTEADLQEVPTMDVGDIDDAELNELLRMDFDALPADGGGGGDGDGGGGDSMDMSGGSKKKRKSKRKNKSKRKSRKKSRKLKKKRSKKRSKK